MGGPLAESTGERFVATAADGDLDDGTCRRTAALDLIRVGVGIVVVVVRVFALVLVVQVALFVDAAGQLLLAAGRGAADAALV
jgi:hypothetical protein